jgi:hypothetical protein
MRWIHGIYGFGANWRILFLMLSRLSCFLSTHVSFWYFFYTGPGSTDKCFFLAGSAFELSSPQTIITPHYFTYHFSLNQRKHFIMADQLPLAELSIQNKIRQHDETAQPIKTKKIHP